MQSSTYQVRGASFGSGVLQSEKLRAAGDFEQNATNRAAEGLTPINPSTWAHFSSMIKPLMDQCAGTPLGFAKADRQAACKQLPLRPDRRKLAKITLRDPRLGAGESSLPNTQPSGSATAAVQYNCLSRIIATLATRLLRFPPLG